MRYVYIRFVPSPYACTSLTPEFVIAGHDATTVRYFPSSAATDNQDLGVPGKEARGGGELQLGGSLLEELWDDPVSSYLVASAVPQRVLWARWG